MSNPTFPTYANKMVRPLYIYMEDGAPVLVDTYGGELYIELRAYGHDGRRQGDLWQTIPREEAVKMANAILEWAKGAEE